MRFTRLVEDADVDAAADAVRAAQRAGFESAWLAGDGADPRMVAARVNTGAMKLVLQLDPADDASVPAGLPIELAVAGGAGWSDALGALLRAAPYDPAPAAWVRAGDIGTLATAARAGVGAALAPFETPEDAADWTAEFEAELGAASAAPLGSSINARVAVFVDAGDDSTSDPGELVGLIERYREAGVDEVILSGAAAGDRDFVEAVTIEFADEEVRAAAAAKAQRIASSVAALEGRGGPAQSDASAGSAQPAGGGKRRSKAVAQRIAALQLAAVRRMSDRQLELIVGNRLGVRALFHGMARMYRPAKAGDFSGPIEFTLTTRHGPEVWTLDCSPQGAKARRAASPDAKLRLEARIADFLRVGVGEVQAPGAVLSGKLDVRGDFGLALKLGEMFGGPSIG